MIIFFKILSAGRRQELGRTSAGENLLILPTSIREKMYEFSWKDIGRKKNTYRRPSEDFIFKKDKKWHGQKRLKIRLPGTF